MFSPWFVCEMQTLVRVGGARLFSSSAVRCSAAAVASASSEAIPSFSRGLFFGKINTKSVHPYPVEAALNEEARSTLSMMAEPAQKFFNEQVDAAANDENASVPPDVLEHLKSMGAFGLQVRKAAAASPSL